MKFVDAYILARTKRKTRRIRTALVVIVSSLLFAILFVSAFVAQGIIDAGKQVGDVGFNSRNLAMVSPTYYGGFDYEARGKDIETQMNAELKARKIKVTDQLKQEPAYQVEKSNRLNKLMAEEQLKLFAQTEANIHSLGKVTALYHFTALPFAQFGMYQPDPNVDPLVEQIKAQDKSGGGKEAMYGNPYESDQLEFYSAESGMFGTQIAPGQTAAWEPGQPYPIVVSYGYLEKLGKKQLGKLSATERNKGYRELIKEFTGKELPFCYRNSTAQDQLRTVMQYNKTAEADDDKSTTPLDVPNCGNFDQKLLKKKDIISDDNPTGAKPLFPPPVVPGPDTLNVTFKIVGFVPAIQQYGSTDVVSGMLTGISSLPTGPNPAIVPSEVVAADPMLSDVVKSGGFYGFSTLYADFATRADQKAFVAKSCSGNTCGKKDSLFISPFGNIVTALEGVLHFVSRALLIAASVIMVVAALMIMFTISKVIADSTKEIAVFRSLGARRRDIAQIYYTYGMMLAGGALIISVVLAVIGAYVATAKFDDRIAQGLIQASGAYNTEMHVRLLGINGHWLIGITGALIVAAFVGISFPIFISLRRKLITILREE